MKRILDLLFLLLAPLHSALSDEVPSLLVECGKGRVESCQSLAEYYQGLGPGFAEQLRLVQKQGCKLRDPELCNAFLLGSEVRKLEFWGANSSGLSLKSKVKKPPPALIDFLRTANDFEGIASRPRAAVVKPDFIRDLEGALNELPKDVAVKVSKKLIGIFLVEGLGSTGYSLDVFDFNRKPVGGLVILDISLLDRRANEWATWRENTPFIPSPSLNLEVVIETPQENSRKNAIQFILLHEFGHTLAIGENFYPKASSSFSPGLALKFPYLLLSWEWSAEGTIANAGSFFPEQKKIRFYAQGIDKVGLVLAESAYRNLNNTLFPSLYGATSPAEDFAEFFAIYVHSVRLNKPYGVFLKRGAQKIISFEPCISEPRCKAKKEIMEAVLKGP